MKAVLHFLLLVAPLVSVAVGFTLSAEAKFNAVGRLYMTKKFPSGRPVTVQTDEDMAMWFEDKKTGKRQQALKKPVGGRPVTLFTKEDVEAVEKNGAVSPVLDKFKAWVEFALTRPTRGY